jgi:hypothetical protein
MLTKAVWHMHERHVYCLRWDNLARAFAERYRVTACIMSQCANILYVI